MTTKRIYQTSIYSQNVIIQLTGIIWNDNRNFTNKSYYCNHKNKIIIIKEYRNTYEY